MLQSIALMLLLGMALGWLCKKVRLPGLVGMIATGMILGPYGLGWLDSSILDISSQLRRIALIIILLRAGLSLNLEDLKKAGRPAILMCFVPACFEVTGMIILAPILLGVSVRSARALILKVKVLSAPVSGKHIANKTRVSVVRWNLKEVCGKPSVRRTEIMYKAYSLDKTADQVKVQMLTKGC